MATVLDCIDCGGEGTLTVTSTLIGCKLCGVLCGRCNGQWVQAEPPRRGIVEAMQREIPSDAHLCPSCKLCPGNDGGLCEQCLDMICEWSSDWNWPEASVIREFRDLGKGG